MRQDPLEQWYKEGASKVSTTPSEEVWSNIAVALDNDPLKTGLVRRLTWWTSAFFVAVVGASVFLLSGNDEVASVYNPRLASTDVVWEIEDVLAHHPASDEVVLQSTGADQSSVDPAIINNVLPTITPTGNSLSGAYVPASIPVTTSENVIPEFAFERANVLQASLSETKRPLQLVSGRPIADDIPEHNGLYPNGFYVGIQTSVDNIWALNPDTYNGWDSESLVLNKTKFGLGATLVGGVNLNNTHAVQLEVQLHKSQGQAFGSYNEGNYYENNLNLNYSRLNFIYKYRKVSEGQLRHPHATNLLAGTYLGYLRSAYNLSGQEKIAIRDHYLDFDSGLLLGLEHERMIAQNWSLSGGVRTSVGLTNIFEGAGDVPRHFNTTRNLSFGGTLSLRYHLVK